MLLAQPPRLVHGEREDNRLIADGGNVGNECQRTGCKVTCCDEVGCCASTHSSQQSLYDKSCWKPYLGWG